ncbi:probable tubulin polyglutamylase TTLL9 [Bolinopsis microptera]|uniref:probable tubulin polyglutamylase TTLL9 n=1 Tax=Bolinopsis microptera TaxID=2820187 RepID=UPI00307A3079
MSMYNRNRTNRGENRVIRFKCTLQNTITDVLRSRGWQEVKEESGDWDFYWADVGWMREVFDHCYMEEHMRLNHFRNHYELTRKNLMAKNLKRLRKQIERDSGKIEAAKCDFFPTTFELPADYHIFVEEFKRSPNSTWIMKPIAKSQGKGIFLFRKLKDIMEWKKEDSWKIDGTKDDREPVENYVVQRYIDNPYLIGGRKFDIRCYVLVTSYMPLKVWLYRSGFGRMSNTRYSLDSIEDTFVHLTNVAIQKTAPDYDPEKGCKWSLIQLRMYLLAKHGPEAVETLFRGMDDIFIKSLQSTQKIMINDKHCFELYGYDILIDESLKPWLLEINASPSLTASNQQDYDLKFKLLHDVLTVIDMEGKLSGKEKQVGGFDLMWNDGPVHCEDLSMEGAPNPPYTTNTMLGCFNNREENLKKMMRSHGSSNKT